MPVNKGRRNGSYVPLSAHYYKDDAIADAGERAELLYVRGLAFCADVLSDGFISDTQLSRFVGVGMRDVRKRAQTLVEVGLWVREDKGYRVAAWMKWNKSNAEIRADASKDAGRKAEERKGKGEQEELGESESERSPNGHRAESDTDVRTDSEQSPASRARSISISTSNAISSSTSNATDTEPDGSDEDPFDDFWAAYPRKVDKKPARQAWDKAIKGGTEPAQLVEAAKRYAASRVGEPEKYTKHAKTWLNQRCWENEQERHLSLVDSIDDADIDPDEVLGPDYWSPPAPPRDVDEGSIEQRREWFGARRAERRQERVAEARRVLQARQERGTA